MNDVLKAAQSSENECLARKPWSAPRVIESEVRDTENGPAANSETGVPGSAS